MARRLSRRNLAEYVVDHLIAGKSRTVVVRQLAAYLIESRRTKELELVVRDIQALLAQKGFVVGTVTSAFDLSAETAKAIERFVKSQTGASQVSLQNQIDPTVLGGVRISLPGQEIDKTVARQLTVLKTRFKKA